MNFQNLYVKYGLIMTAATAVFLLFMHFTGQYSNIDEVGRSPLELLFIVFAPLIIWYLGIKKFKENNHNKLTFKEGVKFGFKISVVYGVTSPFVFLLYYLVLNPDLIEFLRREYGLGGANDGLVITADMVAQLISSLVGGTIYAAIISYFLKTKPHNH